MAAPLEEQFQIAVKMVQSLPKEGPLVTDTSTKLKYYAYYKQATVGKVDTAQPWMWDVTNRAKWDAWNELGEMSKEAAKQAYVNLISEGLVEPEDGTEAELVQIYNEFKKAIGK